MSTTVIDLIEKIDKLASFPEVALRVSEVLEDENSSATDVGAVIEPDPALSVALLRIANSASFNVGEPVDNVTDAIKKVGMREVRDITYAISASNAFKGIPNDLVSVEDFWRHSLYCACAAQHMALVTKRCRGISLFTAGLLHDIGHLIMFNQEPNASRTVLQNHVRSELDTSICEFEREVFGFDHTEVGEAAAKAWQFPETLRLAIRHHHTPYNPDMHGDVACLTGIANSVAVLAELESDDVNDAPYVEQEIRDEFDLTDEILLDAAKIAREGAEALLNIFVD